MYCAPDSVTRIASIGGGPIGGGWAAHFLARDKKTENAELRCAIPSRIGHIEPHDGRWTRAVTGEALRTADSEHRPRSPCL